MTPRALKILLAVSVALNLFAAAAGVTAWVTRGKVEAQVEAQHRPGRGGPVMAVIDAMAPEARDRVRQSLRAVALEARPDFEAARQARRQAIAQAGAETFDHAAVQALLEDSRLAEMRGRARMESGSLEVLAGLEPADRRALAPILSRRGPHGRDRDDRDRGDRDRDDRDRDDRDRGDRTGPAGGPPPPGR